MSGGLGSLGRMLVVLGGVIAGLGGLFLLADRFPGLRLGRLPLDIAVERPGLRFYLPLGTSLLVSLLLSLALWLIRRAR